MSEERASQERPPVPTSGPTCEADTVAPPAGIEREARRAGLSTFESFGVRDFRLFWIGSLLSNTGTWMQTTALGWLVYVLTRDELALGLVNFVAGVPVFLFILFAGAAADQMDRRKLLIWMQWALGAQAVALGWLTVTGSISMPAVYVLAAFGGVIAAFAFPAWQATIPDLVPGRLLLNAIALNSAQFNGARLVGPVLAGAVLALFARDEAVGAAAVFFANAASYLFVVWALVVVRPCQQIAPGNGEGPLARLSAGLRFAAGRRDVAMLLVTQVFITVFGLPFTALMPVLAAETLGQGSVGYSALLAANGGGALVGALALASLRPDARRERIIGLSVPAMGAMLLGVSISRSYPLTWVLLFAAGVAFMAAVSSVNTSLQASTPRTLRGRVISLYVLSFIGIMPFGALAFGLAGRTTGAPAAIGAGAVVLTLYGVFVALKPGILAPAGDNA